MQFHPSTSYEDFVEGYRPAAGKGDGTVSFELTPHPRVAPANRLLECRDELLGDYGGDSLEARLRDDKGQGGTRQGDRGHDWAERFSDHDSLSTSR